MPENKNVKATDAAKQLAEKEGVDLSKVEATGTDGIVVGDVEKAIKAREETVNGAATEGDEKALASDAEEPDTRMFEARLNPELYGTPTSVRIGDKVYENGTPITAAEADELKAQKSGPTAERPGGIQYILRGKEITA